MRPIGSLRDALIAAGRDDRRITQIVERSSTEPRDPGISAREAARDTAHDFDETPITARAPSETPPPLPVVRLTAAPTPLPPAPSPDVMPPAPAAAAPATPVSSWPAGHHVEPLPDAAERNDPVSAPPRTQLVRGRSTVKRTEFHQDPVVGWLVIVGGPGLGAFRPIYEGNNTIGRAVTQRIPLDFGDDAISNEEQAYLRYDSIDRKYLLVPNLAKTNIVAVNEKKPTGAVELSAMDLVTVGRTQLAFVPFCGMEFDWSELNDLKG
jgi:hypothetical protein